MSEFITGDKHGEHSLMTLSHKKWKEGKGLIRNDYLFIAGDSGLLFDPIPSRTELYHLNWLKNCPWTTLVVDGNHDNFERLYSLPQKQWNGGKVGIISENILHLRRGEIYSINNKTYFIFGGARSEDKEGGYYTDMMGRRKYQPPRMEFVNWWKEEEPSYGEMMQGLENLKSYQNKVDYIITHTAPYSIVTEYSEQLGRRNTSRYSLVDYFDEIKKTVQFKRWYFGHFHKDIKLNDQFTIIYNKVIKTEE